MQQIKKIYAKKLRSLCCSSRGIVKTVLSFYRFTVLLVQGELGNEALLNTFKKDYLKA